jgi:hypothetical protein
LQSTLPAVLSALKKSLLWSPLWNLTPYSILGHLNDSMQILTECRHWSRYYFSGKIVEYSYYACFKSRVVNKAKKDAIPWIKTILAIN